MKQFIIRVYGLIYHPENGYLICNETYNGMKMIKFPGGGVEFGEGILDALNREMKEEFGIDVPLSWQHVYTTDFFQVSAFKDNHQIISVYYKSIINKKAIRYFNQPISQDGNGVKSTFWIPENKIKSDIAFTFPIDRFVVQFL